MDFKTIAEKLLQDLRTESGNLEHVATGVKLLYGRIAEAEAAGNKPVGEAQPVTSTAEPAS